MGTGVLVATAPGLRANLALTYWNRVEVRPRAPEIADSLAARVRDPLWFLTRQWQTGEFHGEDAGSPAYVQLDARTGPLVGWRPAGGLKLAPIEAPLEELVETEGFTPDLATRVELGQWFEALLAEEGLAGATLAAIIAGFRTTYALSGGGLSVADLTARSFLGVCLDRVLDGVALIEAAARGDPLPAGPAIAANAATIQTVLDALRQDVRVTLGEVSWSEAPAWHPDQLEYQVEVVAAPPDGGAATLLADPDRDATFEWYAFDLLKSTRLAPEDENRVRLAKPRNAPASRLPTHVRFRGMPNPRWWDFERGVTDFGAVTPDRRDLAKLLVMDFMLIHGNDWFAIPYDQDVGTVCRIASLVVHDVFGGISLVDRADAETLREGADRWTCFSVARTEPGAAPADFFLLPPSAASARMSGEALEEVRFARDEQANYIWGIEHTSEGGDGRPWSGHERSVAESAGEPAPAPPATDAPLLYQLQSFVPRHWFPVLPVAIDVLAGETALEVGRMVRPDLSIPEPNGRVLRPPGVAPYRIREETIPRVGVRVLREPVRSRWLLGATHLWVARRRLAGRGEGSSGLRYDRAVLRAPPAAP